MAKKNDNNSLLQLVGGSVDVDKSDVVAVMVAKVETDLNAAYKYNRDESKRLNAEAAADEKAVYDELVSKFTPATKVYADSITNTVGSFGPKNEIKITASIAPKYEHLNESDKAKIQIESTVTLGQNGSSPFSISRTLPVPDDEAKPLIEKLNGATAKREQAKAHDAKAVDVQRNLRDIPSIQRNARAQLAVATLSQTDGGKDLLERLVANAGDIVKALPSS